MEYKLIQTIKELKEACLSEPDDYVHFRMLLGDGYFFSSKRILYTPLGNTFSIINEIDDSYQDDLTEEELKTETMIIEAIEKGALYQSLMS